jgi:hypothetical protein
MGIFKFRNDIASGLPFSSRLLGQENSGTPKNKQAGITESLPVIWP